MAEQHFAETNGENPPTNYEHRFVPVIGVPLATDFLRVAALRRQIGAVDHEESEEYRG